MWRNRNWFAIIGLAIAIIPGCGQRPAEPVVQMPNPAAKNDEHGHKAGAHGGVLIALGADEYHAEAVFEGGALRLFLLDRSGSKVIETEAKALNSFIKAEGAAESVSLALQPDPQAGDAAGQTSAFKASLPAGYAGKKLTVTVPALRIGGDRYRLAFSTNATDSHKEEMPTNKIVDSAERNLYLTPGGIYTLADIEANGKMTASQKFASFKPSHDLKPKMGDKICPITLTKANSQCTWIIGAKTYRFCCPPCVDEFVQLAKEKPQEVKQPEAYLKQ